MKEKIKLINIPAITESGIYRIDTNEEGQDVVAEREFKVTVYIDSEYDSECNYDSITDVWVDVSSIHGSDPELEQQLKDDIEEHFKDRC